MPWFRRRPPEPWFTEFIEDLRAFARSLPEGVRYELDHKGHYAYLRVEPPTSAHRGLVLEVQPGDFEYALGRLWTEQITPTRETAARLLAMCDAVRDGRVREVRDRETRLIYHLYRLKTRGLDEYARDSQYAFRHRFRRPIRKVEVRRLPPLSASEVPA